MIELLFFPIQFALSCINLLINDYGLSIIIFSILLYLSLSPLRKWAFKLQLKETLKQQAIQPKINHIKQHFKGEKAHHQLEKLYKEEHYSPFSPLKRLAGLSIQIPILILIYYSLLNDPELQHGSLLGFIELSTADNLLIVSSSLSINLLPILMWGFGIISALLMKPTQQLNRQTIRQQQKQGILLNTLFLILLYQQPAAVVLYWASNTFLDLLSKIKTAT